MIYKSIFDVRKLNERMKPQKCEVTRVVDGENLEDFIWPSKVVSSSFVDSSFSKKSGSMTVMNLAEFYSQQPASISGSNHTLTTIYTTVTGEHNNLSGGNAAGRDLSQEMWNQLGPLFALAFFVLLLAVILAVIINKYQLI